MGAADVMTKLRSFSELRRRAFLPACGTNADVPGGLEQPMLDIAESLPKIESAPLFNPVNSVDYRRAEAWLMERIKRGKTRMFSEEVELTPTLAALLLTRNPDNRVIKPLHVNQLATDMAEGAWSFNGESIKLSVEGLLNDGQHRCSAVVQSGVTIRILITFGCERESRLTLDQNWAKSPGDYLSMDGVADANHAAAVAGMVWQWQHHGRVSSQGVYRPTKSQIRETFAANPLISDSVRVVHRKGSGLLGGASALAFCHYVFAQRNAAAADAFIARLLAGDNLQARDPIFLLRERMISRKKISLSEKAALIFCAWNAHRQNRRMSKLQIMDDMLPPVEG